jgi:magnesium transporter
MVLWSNLVAPLIPLAARKLKVDPSLVTAPLITSIVDAAGLLIYFLLPKEIPGI